MLYRPPRRFEKRLAELEGFQNGHPILRCVWDRRSREFVVQRQAQGFRRGRGWVNVLHIGPQLRAGGPTEIGSGDMVIRELRARDMHARYGPDGFDKFWKEGVGGRHKAIEQADAEEREVYADEVVHDMEDAMKMRHHVPQAGVSA